MNYSNVRNTIGGANTMAGPQYNFSQYQQYNSQPMFPQPSGNAYFINNSLEVANIPVGAGMSAVLCLPENLLYIKSMQNGMPMLLGYKLNPLEPPTTASAETQSTTQEDTQNTNSPDFTEQLAKLSKQYENKFQEIEQTISALQTKIGGLTECQF